MRRLLWTALFLLGCALDRTGHGAVRMDASFDAGFDAGEAVDAQPMDADGLDAPPDAQVDDSGLDAGPPDAFVPPDTGPPPACGDVYGSVRGYVPCPSAIGVCDFYANPLELISCDEICSTGGGVCTSARMPGAGGALCMDPTTFGCSEAHDRVVCTCDLR